MSRNKIQAFPVLLVLFLGAELNAEPVYITDRLHVGLHEEKTLDSAIITNVASGSQLELIKREDNMSFVSSTAGITGWIDNSYLISEPPASEQLRSVTEKFNALQQQQNNRQAGDAGPDAATGDHALLSAENSSLRQQFNSERLKVGELQVTIAELRKRLGQDNDADALYREIDALRQSNKDLEIRLANALAGTTAEHISSFDSSGTSTTLQVTGNLNLSWRNLLVMIIVLLVIGLAAGVYLMDYLNRRRHGGFRI